MYCPHMSVIIGLKISDQSSLRIHGEESLGPGGISHMFGSFCPNKWALRILRLGMVWWHLRIQDNCTMTNTM